MKDLFSNFLENDATVKYGLPGFVYTSEEFREIENQSLFPNNWVFVGFAHELEFPGDVQPITVAGKPFFLIRDNNDNINAFHNVCRHRCLKLVNDAGNCGEMIQCPYHSWVYDLEGNLKAAPYFGGKDRKLPEGFSLEDNGLVSIRCETWHDWIFVNIDDNAQSFDDFVKPLKKQIKELHLDQIKPIATIEFGTVACNWKLLMENFIEPYHVQFVHKTTTSQPLVDHYTVVSDHCLGSACDIEEDPGKDTSGTLAVTSRFLTLFPNFVMGTYAPDQIGVHLNIPVGPSETRQKRVIYIHKNSQLTYQEIEGIRNLWHDVHKEDHEMCERLQIGRTSDIANQGGYLSPHWEDSVRRFQELVWESVKPAIKWSRSG